MKKISLIIITVLALSGCKATVETEVSLKDILESKTKTITGDLFVEVAGCNDYKDSRQPSSSLVKVQQTIPSIFPDAKYVECFRKEFDSCVFRAKLSTDSEPNFPPIPMQTCH
ncbi:DUF7424 family protein [Desulfuromonas sp. DDH964]|uniref:DUF7424 family protein n=1 Tax=Desulfuromonas sp. DDH964 TaxID=1823759 RepID=UPI0012FC1D41|nr:hypothetical protein [Desulfuromonas sp. DDH964]